MSKISCKQLVLFPLTALFLFGSVTVQAATFYVATTGNDASPGTVSQPFRTLARGVNSLNAGDTLYIRGGTYDEAINVTSKTSGSAGNYYTIAGYPGETVTLTQMVIGTYAPANSYYIFENFILDGVGKPEGIYWTIGNASHDITLRNLEIKNWFGHGLLVGGNNQASDNIQVINCRIHDVRALDIPGHRYLGIYFWRGNNGLLDGNDIYNNPGGGIQIYPGPTGYLTVRNNRIHDNSFLSTQPIGGIAVNQNVGTGLKIYNNLIYRNGVNSADQSPPGIEIQFGPSGAKIWNNTIYGNKGWGFMISTTDAVNNEVRNNIVYGNGVGQIYDIGAGTVKDHNLTNNPNFMNTAASDFNLQTNSPAIDAGVNLIEIKTDFKKNPRPQGFAFDIGAYEVGTKSTSLSPPANLRVQ
jgi:parallel beta-helix repeat protein